jgi:hypothetical protein
MAKNNECYGFFENEWNATMMRVVLPEWNIKTINIFSKEPNIPYKNIATTMLEFYNDFLQKNEQNTVTLIITKCSNFLPRSEHTLLIRNELHYTITDIYGSTRNGWYYGVTIVAHNAIEHGYCDERELYTTTQVNALLIATIHEQQNDFTQYDENIRWKAIDYIFADSFIVKIMCGF